MTNNDIQLFRRNLRRFERLNQMANATCCSGITLAQCHVLLEIEHQVETTAKQLSEDIWLDKSTLSRTVEGLKKQGFVKRRTSSHDRRFTVLTLTRKGKEKCNALNKYNDKLYNDIFEKLSQKNKELFLNSFDKMVRAFIEYCQDKKVCITIVRKECDCNGDNF